MVAVERKRSFRNFLVAKHEVHLDGSLLGLECQESLPHGRITVEESRKDVGVHRYLTCDWWRRQLYGTVVGASRDETLCLLALRVHDLVPHVLIAVFSLMRCGILLLAVLDVALVKWLQCVRWICINSSWLRVCTVCRWRLRYRQNFHSISVVEVRLRNSRRDVQRSHHWRV